MIAKTNVILFIKGRPDAHKIHRQYAESISARQRFEDSLLRWHDKPGTSKLKRYLSWLSNGIALCFYPEKILFTEGVRIPALISKKLSIIRRKHIIALMADESLYFIANKKYSWLVEKLQTNYLNNCDALICIGDFQADLARRIVSNPNTKIKVIKNGLSDQVLSAGRINFPDFNSTTLIFVGHGPSAWRADYKGLDTIIGAVNALNQNGVKVHLNIIGSWDAEVISFLNEKYAFQITRTVTFVGAVKDIKPYFQNSFIYLHCSNGDAYPTSVIEAMAWGLIPIISETTGTQELVNQLDSSLIVKQNTIAIAAAIRGVLAWTKFKKEEYSIKSKQIVAQLNSDNAQTRFKETLIEIIKEVEVGSNKILQL